MSRKPWADLGYPVRQASAKGVRERVCARRFVSCYTLSSPLPPSGTRTTLRHCSGRPSMA
jgi:hypothetical protein